MSTQYPILSQVRPLPPLDITSKQIKLLQLFPKINVILQSIFHQQPTIHHPHPLVFSRKVHFFPFSLLIALFDWEQHGALQAIYILEVPPLFVFGIPASFIRKSYHHQ